MEIKSLINEDLIELNLVAVTQKEVISQLTSLLAKQGRIDSESVFFQGVLEREAEFTTGFGNGFAIPHCKSDTVKTASIIIGKTTNEIDWNSLDDKPVTMIIMLAIPAIEGDTTHLQILAALSGKLMDDEFRYQLMHATQPKQVLELMDELVTQKSN
ncbi:PTS sugar transporter subunit IIA [Metabacillus hrfriensis]|uniref:Fructose PTS transporter subunit IIA n=1 Tax=Metabacillus hrfriensis TaxID=3048891 RepID=A0ACD4RC80_9BACI|nr:fructose PTS transporter subunit IIA [Metabacillus sp. CT-WN-B3]USK28885.1 fructose PTS transporter subunit IIA [Bacillus sp. CMF21]WHZ58101.1 fructose PTS transporter subunit IIA [Metabacillus sp. CT-WN-B3]